ncbi:hypothetical protein KIPB_007523, partial [Kipferlia bialata]|eukprot:g7523.t1
MPSAPEVSIETDIPMSELSAPERERGPEPAAEASLSLSEAEGAVCVEPEAPAAKADTVKE